MRTALCLLAFALFVLAMWCPLLFRRGYIWSSRYEHGLLIAVTAVLGGALLAKGLDSLVRPGGKEHLDVTTLTGHDLMTDVRSRGYAQPALSHSPVALCFFIGYDIF